MPDNRDFNRNLGKLLGIEPDEGKYDHKQDPNDVTGHMEADPELCRQMIGKGLVVRWAIDGRYRLTPSGQREMARRREEILKARRENSVQPFDQPFLDKMAKKAAKP